MTPVQFDSHSAEAEHAIAVCQPGRLTDLRHARMIQLTDDSSSSSSSSSHLNMQKRNGTERSSAGTRQGQAQHGQLCTAAGSEQDTASVV